MGELMVWIFIGGLALVAVGACVVMLLRGYADPKGGDE